MKYLLLLIIVLGIVIALWSNAVEAAIIAAVGSVYVLLENHPELQYDAMGTIIKLNYTWIPYRVDMISDRYFRDLISPGKLRPAERPSRPVPQSRDGPRQAGEGCHSRTLQLQ